MEERRTAELLSDFDDYEIEGGDAAFADGEDAGKAAGRKRKKHRRAH
jgi:hypothetical protein